MRRTPATISDATIRETRTVTATGALIGTYPLPPDRHALVIAVDADAEVEIE